MYVLIVAHTYIYIGTNTNCPLNLTADASPRQPLNGYETYRIYDNEVHLYSVHDMDNTLGGLLCAPEEMGFIHVLLIQTAVVRKNFEIRVRTEV